MEIFELTYPETFPQLTTPPYAVAIGFFDGIHKGHQAVIQEAVALSHANDKPAAVMTFTPHPTKLFHPEAPERMYLMSREQKVEQLKALGVDQVFFVTFDWNLARLSPENFIDTFIVSQQIQHVVAGFDFTFGAKGQGNMSLMKTLSAGRFQTTAVGKVTEDGEKVASSTIRKQIEEGEVDAVVEALGHPFSTEGIVVDGDKRGRTIGFPTANLRVGPEIILPKNGVYAVYATIENEKIPGVCNVGVVPTFTNGQNRSVEVHLIDFDQEIYGKTVRVEWIERIRDEQKFDSIDALIAQIGADKVRARTILQNN